MSILSRVSSKTGQLLAGSVFDVEFDIEMWGGKGDDVTIFSGASGVSESSRKGGLGGYTKLTMIVPSNYKLQIRPSYYAGGEWGGGVASGFGVDDEWLAVVGGGGGAGYRSLYSFDPFNFGLQYMFPSPGGDGSGGYNSSSPENGEDGSGCNAAGSNLYGERLTAGGGGGAPGGLANGEVVECPKDATWSNPGGTGSGGSGGGGNIRIYKDQSILDGYLNIFPDIKMTYVTHANGTSTGAKVRVTNKKTGNFLDYINNTDIKALEISKI